MRHETPNIPGMYDTANEMYTVVLGMVPVHTPVMDGQHDQWYISLDFPRDAAETTIKTPR